MFLSVWLAREVSGLSNGGSVSGLILQSSRQPGR
jgi:hypothetical protein